MIHRLALVVVVATKTGVHKANNAGPDCTFTILFARCLSHQGFFRGRGQPPSLYICYTLLKIMGLDIHSSGKENCKSEPMDNFPTLP